MKRRQFLQLGAASLSAYLVAPGSARAAAPALPGRAGLNIGFPQGVASADPWPTSVVLWTRAEPDREASQIAVLLQISEQESFDQVVIEERLTALAAEDYTLRITADGLAPDRCYYYRFRAHGADSPVGRTRTAPSPTADRHARFALVSCQNYEAGYFTAYRHLIAREADAGASGELDFILHVGDFIYESLHGGGVRTFPNLRSGTVEQPAHAESLADYRHIYRSYLSDTDLQNARARWPFICTWDDHEFSNDHWQSNTTYGPGDKPEPERHHAASQAWAEYVPARASWNGNQLSIHRDLRWGRHAHLIVTDCRSYRSDHALPETLAEGVFPHARAMLPLDLVDTLDAGRTANNNQPPEKLHYGSQQIPNVRRESAPGSVLGEQQKAWLKQLLVTSDAAWKLCAFSIPMLPIQFDFNLLGDTVAEAYIMTADGWDGYPAERRELLEYVRSQGVEGFVSLTADLHMHLAGVLATRANDAAAAGIEFGCAGLSSTSTLDVVSRIAAQLDPDIKRLIRAPAAQGSGLSSDEQAVLNLTLLYGKDIAERATRTAAELPDLSAAQRRNRHLRYLDTGSYGYVIVTCDAESLHAAHIAIEAPLHERTPETMYVAEFNVPRWRTADGPAMTPPTWSGTAPYPFID